jgi:hypothetical protein
MQALEDFKLTGSDTLASLNKDNGRNIVARIVEHSGVESSSVEPVVELLVSVARTVEMQEGGKIQRFLRRHGEVMKTELAAMLTSGALDVQAAEHIATLWLQNTCNLPILANHDQHIRAFSRRVGISERELLDSADRMDVNVSVLDDLLALANPGDVKKSKGKSARKRWSKMRTRRRD